jgi:hypothetical protein
VCVRLSVIPTCAFGDSLRITSVAQPCESSRWCAAAIASSVEARPGAWMPSP